MPSTDVEEAGTTPSAESAERAEDTDRGEVQTVAEGEDGESPDASPPGRPGGPDLRRSVVRLKRAIVRIVSVRLVNWDTVEVSLLRGIRPRRYRLDDERADRILHAAILRIDVPDAATLDRLAGSCVLRGSVREVRLRVATMPTWLRGGLRPTRVPRDLEVFSWQARGNAVEVRLRWRRRRNVARALADVSATVLRPRRWEQTGGPVPVLDRASWLRGASTWPHGVLDASLELANGPFSAPPDVDPPAAGPADWPLGTALANPHGRRLLGPARAYTLDASQRGRLVLRSSDGQPVLTFSERGSVEQTLVAHRWDKYAVADVGPALPEGRFAAHVLTALAACGVVLVSGSAGVRAELAARGLVTVADQALVDGLVGYQLSVAASRNTAVRADQSLRHTVLGRGNLPVPTVSVLVASKRAADVMTCLRDLAAQTYPSFEVLVGTHGYRLDEATLAELRELLPVPLRVLELPADDTLGEILGTLARHADGEFVAKVDDDDRYGPEHLTDLILATRTSGADLVAKSARFVHLADTGQTIDRTWAATEAFEVTPAGGTMLISRGALQAAGGWSTSPRHVDADLLTRIRSVGGITYRTHGLGYVYLRRSSGHTWQADSTELLEHGEVLYGGLPEEILTIGDQLASTEGPRP